jgi:hypothetical protein
MEAEVIEVLVLRLPSLVPLLALLFEGGVALLECIQVHVN